MIGIHMKFSLLYVDNASDYCTKTPDQEECIIFYFIMCGIIGQTICFVRICGNIISLIVLCKIGKRSVSFFLLKSLAIVDCIYLISYGYNWSFEAVFNFFGYERISYRRFQYFWMYIVYPVYCSFLTASSWIVCLLTIHRLV